MMKCNDAKALVDAWERGEDAAVKVAWSDFAAHLERCDRCANEFGVLLPLMERDAGVAFSTEDVPGGFSDRVMGTVAAERGTGSVAAMPSRRIRRWIPAMAAAAALFIVGVGVGLHFGARGSDTVRVTFMLYAPTASKVQLAGDFSSWNPGDFSLKKVGDAGIWEVQVPLQRGRVYVYNFVIDGTTWITDPKASGIVNDGFGGSSSILRL